MQKLRPMARLWDTGTIASMGNRWGNVAALTLAITLVASAAPAPHAHAQEGEDAATTALARALFQEGLQLVRERQWNEAVDRFRRVNDIRPTPSVRLNLASALVELGYVVEASEMLLQVVADPDSPSNVRAEAEPMLELARSRIGRLIIRLQGDNEGTQVALDGRTVLAAAIGVAAPVDPGPHTVELSRDGHVVAREEVDVPRGESTEVTLTVPPPSPPQTVAVDARLDVEAEASSDGGVLGQWWLWAAVGGAVLAAVIVGVALSAGGGEADPTQGNFDPPFLDVMVMP